MRSCWRFNPLALCLIPLPPSQQLTELTTRQRESAGEHEAKLRAKSLQLDKAGAELEEVRQRLEAAEEAAEKGDRLVATQKAQLEKVMAKLATAEGERDRAMCAKNVEEATHKGLQKKVCVECVCVYLRYGCVELAKCLENSCTLALSHLFPPSSPSCSD